MFGPAAPGVLAHPLLETVELPVSPLAAGLAGAAVVAAAGYLLRAGRAAPAEHGLPMTSWEGRLSRFQVLGRGAAVLLLLLVIAAGRTGPRSEVANLAPALAAGLAWPLLLLASALIGPVWRWLDPWDGAARAVERAGRTGPAPGRPPDVRLAILPAVAAGWYLVVAPGALRPDRIGLVLGVYSLVTVAAAVAAGRGEWLGRAEPVGVVLSWVARIPRGRLRTWSPPSAADVLAGAALGGAAFALIHASALWAVPSGSPRFVLLGTLGIIGAAAVGALAVTLAERVVRRRRAAGLAVAAAVPAFVSLALAHSLTRARGFTSLRVAAVAASDPFGLGWDLFGTADWTVGMSGPGPAVTAWIQVAVVLAGHVAGTRVAASRARTSTERDPAIVLLAGSAAISLAAVAAI